MWQKQLGIVLFLGLLSACDTQINIPDATINASSERTTNTTSTTTNNTENPSSTNSNAANNKPPVIHSFTSNPGNVVIREGEKITFNVVATDADSDALTYTWSSTQGTLSSTSGLVTHWSPLNSKGKLDTGTATISVIVSDGKSVATASVNIQMDSELARIDTGSEQIDNPDPNPSPVPSVSSEPTPAPTPTPDTSPEPSPTPVSFQPRDLSISGITASGFSINWTEVVGASAYRFYLNGDLHADNIAETNYTLTGLIPNTTYSVTVSAVTDSGEQERSQAKEAVTSAINVPQGLKINTISGSSVGLSWDTVAGATGYRVYVNGQLKLDNLTAATVTLTGLSPETTYSIAVTSLAAGIESVKSDALSVTTVDPYGNKRLGFLQVPAMVDMDGLDIKNNHAYIGHFKETFLKSYRYVRDFNISSGQYQDIEISTRGATKIAGVAVNAATVWTAIGQFDNDDRNLYQHNITGQQLNRYKLGASGTLLSDIAVDSMTGSIYVGSQTSKSIIKYNPTDGSSQQFFSGSTPIDPLGLAIDASGNVYTFDGISKKIIKYNKADGSEALSFSTTGTNGQGADYGAVSDLAIDPRNGDIYVAGNGSAGIQIFRYDSSGNFLRSFGDADLTSPRKVAVDSSGRVYVIDSIKKGVLVFDSGIKP